MSEFTSDGFENIIKGLGTSNDPMLATTFTRGRLVTQQIANDLYNYNWIAAKGVDIPIDDATRNWRTLLISDADKRKEIEKIMVEFDVKGKINLASKWARVFGGAVILVMIRDDDPIEPLDIDNIKSGSLQNLIVLDRYNIFPENVNRNILSGNFNFPDYYTVSRAGKKIHHSRIIRFDYSSPTILEMERNNFWSPSIFSKTFESIADSGMITQAIGNLVSEANLDVYKIKELKELVAEGQDEFIIKRLKLLNAMKSVVNGSVLDVEDEYQKITSTFTTLPDIDDRYMQKVSGAFDIPLTRFLGISPSGLNATGTADLLNYYDNINSIQENYFRPKLDVLDKIIISSSFGSDEIFEYEFNPLNKLTELEQAEIESKNKDRDIAYLDAGVIDEYDIMENLADNGVYVAIDDNRIEEERANEELNYGVEENNTDE
jgi:phage-related protein (TIGR01555 family)